MTEKRETTAVSRPSDGGFPTLFNLRDQFDRMFDSLTRAWPTPWRDAPRLDAAAFDFAPRVETTESDTAYEITAELPGVDEKDVKVAVQDGLLSISGEKRSAREEKKKDYVMSERSYGSFQRAFTLPENVALDAVSAHFDKGVLKVTLPKSAPTPSKQREIPIAKA